MRRKRLQHHADIFCEMFSGWRLMSDVDSLAELGNGIIEFDFLNTTQSLNNSKSKIDFKIFYEIKEWFTQELKKHDINPEQIEHAKLRIDFSAQLTLGKTRSRTKQITKLDLRLNSSILTDEKEYISERKEIHSIHQIGLTDKNVG